MHEVIDFDKQSKEFMPTNFKSRSLARKANLFKSWANRLKVVKEQTWHGTFQTLVLINKARVSLLDSLDQNEADEKAMHDYISSLSVGPTQLSLLSIKIKLLKFSTRGANVS